MNFIFNEVIGKILIDFGVRVFNPLISVYCKEVQRVVQYRQYREEVYYITSLGIQLVYRIGLLLYKEN